MRVSILTLGCKVNQAESTLIEGNLSRLGFSIVDLTGQPDYCIVNTCAVTAKSDYQSRQLIRKAVRTGARVIVTGCYTQVKPDEVQKIDGIFQVVRNVNKYTIINMLYNITAPTSLSYSCRSRPYIKVQDGCNNACTYCIVPKARGRSRSTAIEDIVRHVSDFESQGYNEIVLTGIHLGSYGYDLEPKSKLSYLLKTILNKTTIRRIRLSSIEVNEIDKELIDLLKEERICRHIHIPLQSGDDSILKLMKRMYTGKEFITVVENIRREVPDIAIGTDVIVGFPGEDKGRFLKTSRLLEFLPISYMHIFPFSPRPGTIASGMANQIPDSVKKERFAEVNALNIRKREEYMSLQMNKILDIIVEEHNDDQTIVGTSSNYLKVKTSSDGLSKKSLMYVRICGTEGSMLRGVPIDGI